MSAGPRRTKAKRARRASCRGPPQGRRRGEHPDGYVVLRPRAYRMSFGGRAFLVAGKTDRAVALMKSTRIYPLRDAQNPPAMRFTNGSHQEIDTVFVDNYP